MAAVNVRVGAFHEFHHFETQTVTTTNALDVEIVPDTSCALTFELSKPSSAVASAVLKRKDGVSVPLFPSVDSVGKTVIQVQDVLVAFGDEVEIDVDTTSGTKVLSGVARRL